MTNCKLCQQKITGGIMGCSKGCLCRKCSKDISLAKQQPIMSSDAVLWRVAETFFRKGKGEDVSFEQVWKENENENNKIPKKVIFKKGCSERVR